MIFAAPYLSRRGFEADAKGCRQFGEGVGMLAVRKRRHSLPRVAILALGANGPIGRGTMARALHVMGRHRVLALVTARRSPISDREMHRAARLHPDRVLLIDWVAYSAGHGSWFGAFTDGRLVAQLGICSAGRGIARYQSVETHPAARGQGLAGTLVYEAGRHAMAELAASTLVIVAESGHQAERVYRSVGFEASEDAVSFERPPGF